MHKNNQRNKVIRIILPAITLVAIVLAGYFYYQFVSLKQDPQEKEQKEITDLVERVDRLFLLPQGETPTIATISDTEKLKNQAFFANAQKGDKVLIYSKAKKAILYSVTRNKVLNVSTLDLNNKTDAVSSGSTIDVAQ